MTYHRVMLAALALTLMLSTPTPAAAQDTGFGAGTPETRYFRVEASVSAGRGGPHVEGYVYNVYDFAATRVRLRVESLDGAGRALDTRVILVQLDVPPRGRSYFRGPVAPGATSARVSVLNFDWVPRGGGA